MSDSAAAFSAEYLEALGSYLAGGSEAALQGAYELGRRAMAQSLGVLDVTRVHHHALGRLAARRAPGNECATLIQTASTFLMETLSPFEAAHRGFLEAYEQLRTLLATLEKRNADLKASHEALESRERQLADAQRMARLGSWEWDIRTGEVHWSDELYRIFQREKTGFQPTFHAYLECLHPDDRERTRRTVEAAAQDLTAFRAEERMIRPDGAIRFLHTEGDVVRDHSGGAVRMVGFCQDVTEQHLTEEALRESKEHYFQLFQQAREMEENLRQLSSRILRAQEEERTRISRELHDEVGQTLTAINMNLTDLRARLADGDPGLVGRLGDSQQLLESSMETVHRFARELRPAMLDDLGLSPAIRSQLNCFSQRTGVETRCRISPIVAKLDPDRNTVIYRIVQESLNNIAKHARAGRVEVDIRRQGQHVCVQVRDDGRGFPAGSLPGSSQRLGLLGMQERVKLVSGELSVASEPGRGTTVRALIPLKAAASLLSANSATASNPGTSRPPTSSAPKLEMRA